MVSETSPDEIDLITQTLEICAERSGDIVPPVFERFFELDENARALMNHSDQHMQGRMFESVLELLMSDEHFGTGKYLEWELDNHIDAYQATPRMYAAFFEAVRDIVRDGVGGDWRDEFAQAWQARIDRIMKQVHAH